MAKADKGTTTKDTKDAMIYELLMKEALRKAINKRYEMVSLIDGNNTNPNGDLDADNAPRISITTGKGLMSPQSDRRKKRNMIAKYGPELKAYWERQAEKDQIEFIKDKDDQPLVDDLRIYVNRDELGDYLQERIKSGGENMHNEIVDGAFLDKDKKTTLSLATKALMLGKYFYDVRAFGAVLSVGEEAYKAGTITGPVSMSWLETIDRLNYQTMPLTCSLQVKPKKDSEKESEADESANGTIGRSQITPYGLYKGATYISPGQARKTGFSNADLRVLLLSMAKGMDEEKTSSKDLRTRKVYVFEHQGLLGACSSQACVDSVKVSRKAGVDEDDVSSYNDYDVTLDLSTIKEAVVEKELRVYTFNDAFSKVVEVVIGKDGELLEVDLDKNHVFYNLLKI